MLETRRNILLAQSCGTPDFVNLDCKGILTPNKTRMVLTMQVSNLKLWVEVVRELKKKQKIMNRVKKNSWRPKETESYSEYGEILFSIEVIN